MYQPRDLDTSSWDTWVTSLVDELLQHDQHETLVLIPRPGTFPAAPPPAKPRLGHRLRMRHREVFEAPVIQAMRDGNSLVLELTGPSAFGGAYPWTADQVEALYDLGWPAPVDEGVVVFTMYLPRSPLPPRPYLPPRLADHAGELIRSTLRDVIWTTDPADVHVEGGVEASKHG